jgi:hypothetical protein
MREVLHTANAQAGLPRLLSLTGTKAGLSASKYSALGTLNGRDIEKRDFMSS